jgi:hypothetical protein
MCHKTMRNWKQNTSHVETVFVCAGVLRVCIPEGEQTNAIITGGALISMAASGSSSCMFVAELNRPIFSN